MLTTLRSDLCLVANIRIGVGRSLARMEYTQASSGNRKKIEIRHQAQTREAQGNVIACINPLRWIQGDPPPLEEVLKTMRERAAKFNVEKVKQEDIVATGGAADE